MTKKYCRRCDTTKDIEEFHKNKRNPSGVHAACKSCVKFYAKEYYQKNRVKYYWQNKQWREANPERRRESNKRYEGNNPNRRKSSLPSKGRKQLYDKLNDAVRRGKIMRPNKCSDCNSKIKVEAHHEDYEKPFEVVWLCRACHVKRHHKIPAYVIGEVK